MQRSPSAVSPDVEFPTIREQDLAMILADWARLKAKEPKPAPPGEVDALDLTVIVAQLATGLHARSLAVIHEALPKTDRWALLRERIETLLLQREAMNGEFADYPERILPVH